MTKHRWVLLLGLVLLALPSAARAQDSMSFDDMGGSDPGADQGGGDSMSFGYDDTSAGDTTGGDTTGGDTGGGDTGGGDLAGLLGPAPVVAAPPEEDILQTEDLEEPDVFAVQQSYVLRGGRVELTPSYGTSLNDPFVTHNCFGLWLGYYITEVLGISLSFQWYQELDSNSEDGFHIARSFRLVVPINEYQLGFNLHFSYVPIYGKLTIFNKWIFHWDTFIEGGVGGLMTRPIPVVDPEVRTFDFDIRVAANIGIGGRTFITKYVAIFAELLDYIYMEQLENLQIASSETTDPNSSEWEQSRFNPDTWLGETKLTNNVMFQVGVSIFFPFTFEYEYPK